VDEVRARFGIPVVAIATLDDVLDVMAAQPGLATQRMAVESYRAQYGAAH
jgi:orotate phosphoribosyltransferase